MYLKQTRYHAQQKSCVEKVVQHFFIMQLFNNYSYSNSTFSEHLITFCYETSHNNAMCDLRTTISVFKVHILKKQRVDNYCFLFFSISPAKTAVITIIVRK